MTKIDSKSVLEKRSETIDAVIKDAQKEKEKAHVRCAKISGSVYLHLDDMFKWLTGIQLNPKANKHTRSELGRVKVGLLAFKSSAKEYDDVPLLNKNNETEY